ncbi:acyl-CoA Delta-9 desaturase isoform X1 [Drosophila teissieri]|uniref:Desaturase 1, isoform A n=3 Tax=Drosophila yakuba TaxID=7245 RepID=B4PPA5_DROYA|nr:acyl-CoA Delta-9 desaturase [Drosophila yakuba]XP_015047962.1 acyl-CoA Delta-9 desaturase [Drosophila yakuba]XP_039232144.1 acyl-CoA Delta-9 desaturase [Drosophila yakuba]XP_039492996.1 acyl-CoA Delta-9 desaturase [Drosophila santomea]XP_039492997.1 acyl-CoA Delta-9 desaturase [Drosophila santomea]XP_039492998.1 acyl-CoA Delta-9 desaturase [Drosophila santomea]XP_043657134.1 acyl-CoA Delta-9 desaturase isoform X1 [Drosophila teissieri]XP_043657135.1 acyl-CoA Delta-9 desaturase isoform X1 
MPPNAQAGAQSISDSLIAAASAAADSGQSPTKLQEDSTGVLFECDVETTDGGLVKDITVMKKAEKRRLKLVWRNIIAFGYLHLAALYGAYLMVTSAKWQTVITAYLLYVVSGLGITAGAHRLWAHRSYKAKWPLRVILIIFNTIAFQDAAYHWARDHRVHHKYSETDADPHNATRGFFFSHVGWLLCKKHPEVKAKGKGVDLSDLRADPILMFQKKYYMLLMPIACFIIPTVVPMYAWGESFVNAWFVATMFRWCFILNVTWLVNSAAHKFGGRPYDKFINPSENISVAILAFGEGWHNYHHVFPWDYKTAEFGKYSLNFTTGFIDFFAKIGWAYDLKTVSTDIIKKRVKRTGDGTHATWGWGDVDQPKEEIEDAVITHKKSE